MNIKRIISWQSGADTSMLASFIRIILLLLSWVYGAIIYVRNLLFDIKLRQPKHLSKKTISIGNITTGGTGKTPFTIEVATRLENMGISPAVILRGYKSKDGKSDEALLINDRLKKDAVVACNSDREKGARAALIQKPLTNAFVLDDCFQHRQVYRDFDIVLIDAYAPFGFNYMLPRGMLREPVSSLKRADAIFITRADQVSKKTLRDIDKTVEYITGKPALGHISFRWARLLDADDNEVALERLENLSVAGICAIGNPSAFFDSLEDKAQSVTSKIALPDHYAPQNLELLELFKNAKDNNKRGADAIITTEKDWVKWRDILGKDFKPPLPIYRPRLDTIFLKGQDALEKILNDIYKIDKNG